MSWSPNVRYHGFQARLLIFKSGTLAFRTRNVAGVPLKPGNRGLLGPRIQDCLCIQLHEVMLGTIILQAFSRFFQISVFFCFTGLIHALSNCSNYTFHENSIEGRNWEQSRWLCQNLSGGDLVSIEEENERIFVRDIIKNLSAIKYFIGLKKEEGDWKWLSNGKSIHATQGESPWASGQPSGTENINYCAAIYGHYKNNFGWFDDLSCTRGEKEAWYICETAVSCTRDQKGRGFFCSCFVHML